MRSEHPALTKDQSPAYAAGPAAPNRPQPSKLITAKEGFVSQGTPHGEAGVGQAAVTASQQPPRPTSTLNICPLAAGQARSASLQLLRYKARLQDNVDALSRERLGGQFKEGGRWLVDEGGVHTVELPRCNFSLSSYIGW